jgi:hypothetical protein
LRGRALSVRLFAALRDHIYFVHVNGAGSFVHRTLYGHSVFHVIFERVGIMDVHSRWQKSEVHLPRTDGGESVHHGSG